MIKNILIEIVKLILFPFSIMLFSLLFVEVYYGGTGCRDGLFTVLLSGSLAFPIFLIIFIRNIYLILKKKYINKETILKLTINLILNLSGSIFLFFILIIIFGFAIVFFIIAFILSIIFLYFYIKNIYKIIKNKKNKIDKT